MTFPLAGKTAIISGASRGIGLEIGKRLAQLGANVAVAAKTVEPHPKLPGTIYTAVEEIDAIAKQHGNDAKGLAIQLDVRNAESVESAIAQTVDRFGNLDIVINNASAINMKPSVEQTAKAYDLMHSINARGTWLLSRYALPHLFKSAEQRRNPHILTLSPPLGQGMFARAPVEKKSTFPTQFAETGTAYAMSKVGMSIATFSLAAEAFGRVGCNTLWPYTLIGTSAMKIVSPNAQVEQRRWRSPEFVAEAAVRMLQEDGTTFTARDEIDEIYLRQHPTFANETIASYNLGGEQVPLDELAFDLFIPAEVREAVEKLRAGQ